METVKPTHLITLIETKSKSAKKIATMMNTNQSVDDILFI